MVDREYVIRLRVPPGDKPDAAIRRIRAALKVMLRRFQLRCVSIEPAEQQPPCKE